MKHLGDITKIHGDQIEPVDCITFGSPCQGLSIAGKRLGFDDNRSVLFLDAARIIKEMRTATNGMYPTFAVWENVPGAFSSNGGEDFRAVLDATPKTTKGRRMNTGKQFEADFKASVPSDAWCYRLKDSAATYYGGNENLSFSIDNICDFLVYRYPMNHLFELKTIETPSIPLEKVFGKYDKAKCKYRKEKRITDMVEAMGYSGQTAHVIVNYRAVNRTFAIPASKVLAFRYNESRKSIPWKWAEQEGIEVKAKRLRVHWRYDVDGLLKRLEKENDNGMR